MDFSRIRFRERLRPLLVCILYSCACLQFVRFYVRSSDFYLNMHAYLAGHERLPFQERILPVFLMRQIFHSDAIMHMLVHQQGIADREHAPFYLLSLAGTFATAILTQMLYAKVSQHRILPLLVFPLLLFCMLWTYVLHVEANYSYPYDLLSLAFFTGGLYCIHQRKFFALLAVMLVGTLNRETTLFLVGIYLIDSASRHTGQESSFEDGSHWLLKRGLSLRRLPWIRAGILLSAWLLVKVAVAYYFRHNDNSENFVRLAYNAKRLQVRLIPALLNVCGYLLPVVLLYWSRIRPLRFGNYILILVMWIPIMLYTGVLLETRIYGELCSWTAIAITLLAEDRVMKRVRSSETPTMVHQANPAQSPQETVSLADAA